MWHHYQGKRYLPWESILRGDEPPLQFPQAHDLVTGYTGYLQTFASNSVGGY